MSQREERYNIVHKGTRRLIENAFGVLKNRFSCLRSKLRVTPERACKIIKCCTVLHNLAIELDDNDILNEILEDFDQNQINNEEIFEGNADDAALEVRNNLIQYL